MAVQFDAQCSRHKKDPIATRVEHCPTCARIRTELKIMRRCVSDFIKAGYLVSLDSGEEFEIKDSAKVEAVMAVAFQTDEDRLYVRKADHKHPGKWEGWVYFVYGNSGWDVINDYTTNLEPIMKGVNAYAETLEPK